MHATQRLMPLKVWRLSIGRKWCKKVFGINTKRQIGMIETEWVKTYLKDWDSKREKEKKERLRENRVKYDEDRRRNIKMAKRKNPK